MKKEDFISLVSQSTFLGEARQRELTDNAPWMTDQEREFLAKAIEKAKAAIEENEKQILSKLDAMEKAIRDFKKIELPKIMKEKEAKETAGEAATVEKLLKKL